MDKTWITAYLERIGAAGAEERNAENLNRLIVSHLQTVPFENIDVADFGMVPELDEQSLYDKIVKRRRGGYCFELNLLFLSLLRGLGYELYPVAVRVVWERDFLPPASHMGLVTVLDGKRYYCDVGFGGPGPKGLLSLELSCAHEQRVADGLFRVWLEEDGDLVIEGLHGGEWKGVERFSDRPVREPDLQLMNFYCARNEKVLFSRTRVVNLCTPGGSKALAGRELTVRENGSLHRSTYRSVTELEEGLAREFGIVVSLPVRTEKSI